MTVQAVHYGQPDANGIIRTLTFATAQPLASAEIEAERARAAEDFLRDHVLALNSPHNDLDMTLSIDKGYFIFSFSPVGNPESIAAARIGASHFKGFFRDYALICDNFYKAARAGEIHRLETIDAGRKALHDEAGEAVQKAVKPVFSTDLPTARRLFTLIYVLHMRSLIESNLC